MRNLTWEDWIADCYLQFQYFNYNPNTLLAIDRKTLLIAWYSQTPRQFVKEFLGR